jgi:AbrB family looped-hinge helix DNA binding protein
MGRYRTEPVPALKVGPQGRLVVPVEVRRELGIEPGTDLVTRVSDGQWILETRENVERRLHARLAKAAPGRLVSEELIADRRLEAEAERERWEGKG